MCNHTTSMKSQTSKKTTRIERDPMYNLERELKIRGFSRQTIKSYLYYNKKLLLFANKNAKSINTDDIKEYLLHLKNKKLSSSTLNSAVNAIKFYYTQILGRKFFLKNEIVRAKKSTKLPIVLTRKEIGEIFLEINNAKHKLILGLMYSSGLRVSEIVNVKVKDLDFENKLLRIRSAKGKKDRVTILSGKIIESLEKYTKNQQGNDYVFGRPWLMSLVRENN